MSSEVEIWSGLRPETGAAWNLHCGDARTVLKSLSPARYSCAITSPPYFWQRDYGVPNQLGLESTIEAYVASLVDVMEDVRRLLRPRGVLFLNLGDTYYSGKGQPKGDDRKHKARRFSVLRAVDGSGLGPPKKTLLGMPWRVALAMIDRGWILRSSIIWNRRNAVPEPSVRDRPWRSYEFVFLFAKSRQYDFSRNRLAEISEEDVWTLESQSKAGRTHPAVFPAELVRRCLAIGNPHRGRVLDPFAGSGTVLSTATQLGIPADGVELNRGFCRDIVKGLRA